MGRVHVEPDLSIAGHPEVFVVGDLAVLQTDGKPVPAVAPAAMQSGRTAARNIVHTIRGEGRERFRYRNKGDLATIGRYKAVGVLAGRQLAGAFAWWTWLLVHIMYLAGFRNRAERAARVGLLVLHIRARRSPHHARTPAANRARRRRRTASLLRANVAGTVARPSVGGRGGPRFREFPRTLSPSLSL